MINLICSDNNTCKDFECISLEASFAYLDLLGQLLDTLEKRSLPAQGASPTVYSISMHSMEAQQFSLKFTLHRSWLPSSPCTHVLARIGNASRD